MTGPATASLKLETTPAGIMAAQIARTQAAPGRAAGLPRRPTPARWMPGWGCGGGSLRWQRPASGSLCDSVVAVAEPELPDCMNRRYHGKGGRARRCHAPPEKQPHHTELRCTGAAKTAEAVLSIITRVGWRMAVDIGPAESAVVVLAPQFAPPTVHSSLLWGESPHNRRLRVVPSQGSSCMRIATFHAHIQHAAAKGRAASYAAAPVLHNRHMLRLALRLMVVLSVVRPTLSDYHS
jgi:hypothetical protein